MSTVHDDFAAAIQRNLEKEKRDQEEKIRKQQEENNAREAFTQAATLYWKAFNRHSNSIRYSLSTLNFKDDSLHRSVTIEDPCLLIIERKTSIGRNAEFKEDDDECPTVSLRTRIGNIALFCVRYHSPKTSTPTPLTVLGFSTDKKTYHQLSSNKIPLSADAFNAISLLDSEVEEAMQAILASSRHTSV
jgi:hypothetical protein